MEGIDVSKWQAEIDWKKVAESGVQFAILRATHGVTSVDEYFEKNYAGAKAAGVPLGAYYYPYYGDKSKFDAGLQNFLKHLSGKTFELGAYIDLEEEKQKYNPPLGSVDRTTLTSWAIEGCKKIEEAGFISGIYANAYWMNTKLDMSKFGPEIRIWCADTSGPINYKGPIDIHQYDFYGKVQGIRGSGVDKNRSLCTDERLLGGQKPSPEEPASDIPERDWTVTKLLKDVNGNHTPDTEVTALQQALCDRGYCEADDVDGLFWEHTEAIVTKYQKDKGLSVDGIAGRETVTSLGGKWVPAIGFNVQVTCNQLNIRSGCGRNTTDVGDVFKGQQFHIVETSGDWGRLGSGKGWINIGPEYCKRI